MFNSIKKNLKELAKNNRYLKKTFYLAKSFFLSPEFNHIEVEITSFCNRKCEYCPNVSFDRLNSEGSFLIKNEVFDTILDQLKDIKFTGTLAPHMYGETLAHPEIVEITQKSAKAGIKPEIYTNADYLTNDLMGKLIDAGLYKLNISKHSKNLSKSSMQVLQSFFSKIEDYKKLSTDDVLKEINGKTIEIEGILLKIVDFYSDFKGSREMLHNRGGEMDLKLKRDNMPIGCSYVLHPVIDVEGNVVLCCNDYKGKHILGNVMERDIYDIWTDPNNVWLRNKIYRGSLDLQICQECVL